MLHSVWWSLLDVFVVGKAGKIPAKRQEKFKREFVLPIFTKPCYTFGMIFIVG